MQPLWRAHYNIWQLCCTFSHFNFSGFGATQPWQPKVGIHGFIDPWCNCNHRAIPTELRCTTICLSIPKERVKWRQTDGHNDFSSSECAVNRFITSKNTSNQIHFSSFSYTWPQYKLQNKTVRATNHELSCRLVVVVFYFLKKLLVLARWKQKSLFNNPAIMRLLCSSSLACCHSLNSLPAHT